MRKILHVDLDAFFASVEEMDDPNLNGHPIAVSGLSDHGIITTANYIARDYGIHSAMPVFIAKKLCPNLILVPIRKARYSQISGQVFHILGSYTKLVEKVSIDEAFLDLSRKKNPEKIAYEIKERVKKEIGISLSCGLSYNKFLAKLASDMNKPDGFTRIHKDQVEKIVSELPIRKIHGIGPKSEKKLLAIGIETGRDLMGLDKDFLLDSFGKAGGELYERIRGIDRRKVEANRVRKSIGCEETFDRHTRDKGWLEKKLKQYAQDLALSMDKKGFVGYTLTVKVKTIDFETHTRSRTQERPYKNEEEIFEVAKNLLEEMQSKDKLRLMGLSLSSLSSEKVEQLYFL